MKIHKVGDQELARVSEEYRKHCDPDIIIADKEQSDEARLQALVKRDLRGARLRRYVLDEKYETTKAESGRDYSERIYNVMWEREDQCGTHRANLNDGERNRAPQGMLVWGHYDMDDREALKDLIARTAKLRDMQYRMALAALTTVH